MILIAAFITSYITWKNRSLNISISDFQDVNVSDIIKTAGEKQNLLEQLKQELDDLKSQYKNELAFAEDEQKSKQAAVNSRRIPAKIQKEQMLQIQKEYITRTAEIKKQYLTLIAEKEDAARVLETEISRYSKDILGKKNEITVDNASQMHEIKMNKQRDYYTKKLSETRRFYENKLFDIVMKYNPVFTEKELQKILDDYSAGTNDIPNNTEQLFHDKSADSVSMQKIKELISVIERLQKINYRNSPGVAVDYIEKNSKFLLDSLLAENEKSDRLLKSYEYSINSLLKQRHDNGYILDPRLNNTIIIFIDSIHKIKIGDICLVYRSDDDYIGKIRINKISDPVTGEVFELADGKRFEALDKLLIVHQ
ncbi:MAG: hypothetical protein A2096_13580 [Spirochaetes bacterium GWF1_41_5]|nr:MAG: hypothetical protein A2096_13580 [Spirochaetes bacterium GWF1_41_5]